MSINADTGLAIQTVGLRKSYRTRSGRKVAVDGLDMKVPRGGVHGFLGPNGSGKTTTIRMLLGLIHAEAGKMTVLGNTIPDQLEITMPQMGAIVEQPKFYPGYSAKFNLELFARAIHAPKGKVDQVLEQVGLAARGGDRFKTYSLGMKQRLAIAATLLKDPEVLIFDEPTNGLDPAGIHEIRENIRALGAAGHTVLVSSHILSEVEQMADTVTIIARGRTLAEGSVAEITGADRDGYRIELADPDDASAVLVAAGFQSQVVDGIIHVVHVPDPALVTKTLVEHGHYPTGIAPMQTGLEQVFLELTDGVSVGEMGEDTPAAAMRGGVR